MEGLRHGKKPKQLQSDLRAKFKDTAAFSGIPHCVSIQNFRYNLTQHKEAEIGMKYLSDVTDFIDKHNVDTKEQCLKKGVTMLTSLILFLLSLF